MNFTPAGVKSESTTVGKLLLKRVLEMIKKSTEMIMLEGLRQALQARVVNLYTVYSTPNQGNADQRLTEGLRLAASCYERALEILLKESAAHSK